MAASHIASSAYSVCYVVFISISVAIRTGDYRKIVYIIVNIGYLPRYFIVSTIEKISRPARTGREKFSGLVKLLY